MARYDLRVVDKAGVGTRLGEIENAQIGGIEWVLNGAGSMSFTLPIRDPKAALTKLVKREVQVWRDDALIWWGVPWQRKFNIDTVEVSCLGLWSYFSKRFVHKSLEYPPSINDPQVEQLTIAWNLVNYAQTGFPGGNLNIVAGTYSNSGVTRRMTYRRHEYANIAEAVHSFTEMKNGFDFEIRVYGDGRREWMPYYPRKGTDRSHVFVLGDNILEFEVEETAAAMANWVTFSGSGDGPATIAETYVHEGSRNEYGLLQDVQSDSNITRRSYLLEKAEEHVRLRKYPIQIISATVNAEGVFGSLDVGDRVLVRMNHGELQVDAQQRVVSMTLTPEDERLALVMNPANLTTL